MSDNNDQNQKPIDPTRSGEDFVGDTTGMTGQMMTHKIMLKRWANNSEKM